MFSIENLPTVVGDSARYLINSYCVLYKLMNAN